MCACAGTAIAELAATVSLAVEAVPAGFFADPQTQAMERGIGGTGVGSATSVVRDAVH
jgi:hypothetical protein